MLDRLPASLAFRGQLARLPPRVGLFYVRARRVARRLAGTPAPAGSPPPRQLAAILGRAAGRATIVETGAGAAWTSIALALENPQARVTTYDASPREEVAEYLRLAPEAAERITVAGSEPRDVDLLVLGAEHDPLATFTAWRDRMADDGIVAFRGFDPGPPGVKAAIDELGLSGTVVAGMFVWRARAAEEDTLRRWSEGLDEEIEYWFRWLRDREPWPEQYELRTDPAAELQPHIQRHLESPDGAHLRILDVGSGPLTVLGKRWGHRRLEITAVDPLADRYGELFERVGLEPLVRPVAGDAEHVAELFPPDSFDMVYAQNCIDHGYDPLRSILQMLELVRPGRTLLLEHAIDEGEFMAYAGPHQWNFRSEDDRFVIWRPGERVDAHAILEPRADVEIEDIPDARWIRVALHKRQG